MRCTRIIALFWWSIIFRKRKESRKSREREARVEKRESKIESRKLREREARVEKRESKIESRKLRNANRERKVGGLK
jgi:hypothetical protein